MRGLGDWVADNAKGGWGGKGSDYQGGNVYPSFIVRL